ncbi:hypothetical protein HK102_001517 [Quaeritorhiza haematococci]|nr:hypothetical protein HK102_001517 [Quaeritorhiza haematococci]
MASTSIPDTAFARGVASLAAAVPAQYHSYIGTSYLGFTILASGMLFRDSMSSPSPLQEKNSAMKYSKFRHTHDRDAKSAAAKPEEQPIMISTRAGMLTLYTTPFLVTLACTYPWSSDLDVFKALTPYNGTTAFLLAHFGKRILESAFLHKYSGPMALSTALQITVAYTLSSITNLGTVLANNSENVLAPMSSTRAIAAVSLTAIGLLGNLYHHWLLANLRRPSKKDAKDGDEKKKVYVVPKGGLFEYVACPHYLFEVIGWLGGAIASGTNAAYGGVIMMVVMLSVRSRKTRLWYLEKVEGYPAERKGILPFVF